MKQNIKPFSVEIKKSRVQGQIHHLRPKRQFEPVPIEPREIGQKDESRAPAEPAPAPRILPSIVEPVWNNAELVEPIRRAPFSKQDNRKQMELDLTVASLEKHASVPVVEAVSQADIPDAKKDAKPVHEVFAAPDEGSKKVRKPRKRTAGVVEPLMPPEQLSRPQHQPERVILDVSKPPSSEAIQSRRTKRQAEAAQLPRSERWKRRLHPASR